MSDDPTKPALPQPSSRAPARRKIPVERLDEIERRWLRGEPARKTERECASAWGVTRRQVRTYIALVRKRLAAAYVAITPEQHRARIETMLVGAYDAAAKGSPKLGPDAKAMVAAARVMAEVAGALGPKTIELTGKNGKPLAVDATTKVVLMPALEVDEPEDTDDGAAASGAD